MDVNESIFLGPLIPDNNEFWMFFGPITSPKVTTLCHAEPSIMHAKQCLYLCLCPILNSVAISSKVLFFVSGTFLQVNTQNRARKTEKGRKVQFSRAVCIVGNPMPTKKFAHLKNTKSWHTLKKRSRSKQAAKQLKVYRKLQGQKKGSDNCMQTLALRQPEKDLRRRPRAAELFILRLPKFERCRC